MALDIFAKFATDETLEEGGTWTPIGGGAELLIARAGNKTYAKLLTRLVTANREVLDMAAEGVDDEASRTAGKKSDEIMVEVMSKSVLLDWRNVQYKGAALPYTPENAAMLLAIKDFRSMVAGLSEKMERFLVKEEAAQGKP